MTYHQVTREEAIQALFDLLTDPNNKAIEWKLTSRRYMDPTQVTPEQCPALVFDEADPMGETYVQQGIGIPDTRTERVKVVIYTHAGNDQKVVPATVLNNMLEAVRKLMIATLAGERVPQTLGGKVINAWINGRIPTIPGDIDGQGMAIVPVEILMP